MLLFFCAEEIFEFFPHVWLSPEILQLNQKRIILVYDTQQPGVRCKIMNVRGEGQDVCEGV